MKSILSGLIIFFFSLKAFAQAGQWTWINGTNISNDTGYFGTIGQPDSLNMPPGLYEPAEWTDSSGNFWLFGGFTQTPTEIFNTLWKYNQGTNQWTWMNGLSTPNVAPAYGTKGIPSPTNHPPALSFGIVTWVDQANNLWLYGGSELPSLHHADLWKYDVVTNEWTWMNGPGSMQISPVFGVMNVPDTSNTPGSRYEVAASWADNNFLWLFGGYCQSTGGTYNDLWKYDISANKWTWVNGTNTLNDVGNFGALGVADPTSQPCARNTYTRWKDNDGNFWLFGGAKRLGSGVTLNDLWKYDPVANLWTWMGGTNPTSANLSTYGTQCVKDTSNWPPSRIENRAAWKDSNGDFWMFGGNVDNINTAYNDLWKYCVRTNEWTWISGSNTLNNPSIYGTKGIANPANVPSSRFGAVSWMGNNNDLYLFGGADPFFQKYWNDLWKFTIDSSCVPCTSSQPLPQANFVYSDSGFCEGVCVDFTNNSVNALTYNWFFPGATPSSDTAANPQNICYYLQGNYDVTLIATNAAGNDTLTMTNAIQVLPPASFTPITQIGDTLFSGPGYISYQWYFDTLSISGATNYFYVANQSGTYSVQVVDSNGCSATATMIGVEVGVEKLNDDKNNFSVVVEGGRIYLNIYSSKTQLAEVQLTDELGKVLLSRKAHLMQGKNSVILDDSKLSAAIYFITVSMNEKSIVKKVAIH